MIPVINLLTNHNELLQTVTNIDGKAREGNHLLEANTQSGFLTVGHTFGKQEITILKLKQGIQ